MIAAAFLTPESARIAIPVALAIGYICYHWWRWRMMHPKVRTEEPPKPTEPEVEPSLELKREPESASGEPPVVTHADRPQAKMTNGRREQQPSAAADGEEDYRRARAMPHQAVPDFKTDGLYIDLLAESANKGYAPALAKLGEYAMRRNCLVEAYYWLWRANRGGMGNLNRAMLQVRNAWRMAGFPRESENEYEYFTHGQGTVGYALLCIDSQHNVKAAKAALAERCPDFLVD